MQLGVGNIAILSFEGERIAKLGILGTIGTAKAVWLLCLEVSGMVEIGLGKSVATPSD